jgi:hypothetical protein
VDGDGTVTGYVPAWAAFLIGFLVFFLIGIPLGVYVGWGLGADHERKVIEAEAEAEAAAAAVRSWGAPETAHEAWTAHVEQAQAIANGPRTELMPVAADTRTDTAWTRDMAADMDRWIAGLLNAHPNTEEL